MQDAVRLRETWPQAVALGPDASVWVTGKYGGIVRVDSHRRVTDFRLDADLGPADIVRGPDGRLWFTSFDAVGWIDANGATQTWRVEGPRDARAIARLVGTLWFTNEGVHGHIDRLSVDGRMRGFPLRGVRASFLLTGIAAGSDGALWFTETGYGRDPPDGIGRMTTSGRYRSWPLALRRTGPTRIAAGPDGALWFAERDAHAIGRITTSGAIRRFPLPGRLSPYGITTGKDGAPWFTADGCIGRISTVGEISTWHVRGAGGLVDIAAAPNGRFWLADEIASAVRHFTPPTGSISSRATCGPPTLTRRLGSTRATLAYRREDRFDGDDFFTDARIRISRGDRQLFSEVVPSYRSKDEYGVFGNASSFAVRDLDGDGEPDALLQLTWNGAHCCNWTRVYRYDAARKTYVAVNHMWGNSGVSIRDLDGDGRPEFDSTDDRFAYDFDGYAGSVRPIQIWSYDQGRFRDVTRGYRQFLRRDATAIFRLYKRYRGKRSVRGILPAWAADEYLLGRRSVADKVLEFAAQGGALSVQVVDGPREPFAYVVAVKRLLRRTGYRR